MNVLGSVKKQMKVFTGTAIISRTFLPLEGANTKSE
jgi:hypothetical protein